jgi:transcription initiation factor IIE alpha subunit
MARTKQHHQYSVDYIKSQLQNNLQWLERAIVVLYEYQTADEQSTRDTRYTNGVGFNGRDARRMSWYAQYLQRGNHLTGKHVEIAKRVMPKYAKQIQKIIEHKQDRPKQPNRKY